ISLEGAYVYVVGEALIVIDASVPTRPVETGRATLPIGAKAIAVHAGRALIAADGSGLVVVDVTDARRPRPVSSTGAAGDARDCWVVGDLVYTANGSGGLAIL